MDPPDFSFENIGDILGSLSAQDLEKLNSLAGQFMGTESRQEPGGSEADSGFNIDPDMLFKIMNIMQRLNSRQYDPRCNLISALRPLLSPARQQKADKAMELLRLISIFSLFNME